MLIGKEPTEQPEHEMSKKVSMLLDFISRIEKYNDQSGKYPNLASISVRYSRKDFMEVLHKLGEVSSDQQKLFKTRIRNIEKDSPEIRISMDAIVDFVYAYSKEENLDY